MNIPPARPRKKKEYTPEEWADRLEKRRASGRLRSAKYYAKKRAERGVIDRSETHLAICRHSCGCRSEILIPVCGLCAQGLCDGNPLATD